MIVAIALACGVAAALPFARLARRELVAARLRDCAPARPRAIGRRGKLAVPPGTASVRDRRPDRERTPERGRARRHRDEAVRRELPVLVDLVGVGVGAGLSPFLALEHAAQYGPCRSAALLREVSRACALGRSFDDALRDLGSAVAALRPLTDGLRASARLGTPAAPTLGRIAVDVRADLRRRSEAGARTVPVRLCFPLVVCVLPAFALLTVAPVVLDGLRP